MPKTKAKTPAVIAAEIEKTFRKNMKLLKESMKGLDLSSRAYLDRVLAVAKLEERYRDERARRNLDPQNLGNAVRTKYEFTASTGHELAREHRTAGEELMIAELDAQYADLPPAQVDTAAILRSSQQYLDDVERERENSATQQDDDLETEPEEDLEPYGE